MRATDYDLKPIAPRRVSIDIRASEAALRHAQKVARQAGADADNLRSVVWASLVDAARTERSLARPGPTGYVSGWPDVWQTDGEIVAAYNDRFAERRRAGENGIKFDDELYRGAARAPYPTAAQVSRYEAVTTWLRFCHAREKVRAIRIVWWRAHGRSPIWISRQDGQAVRRIREIRAEQLAHIANGLVRAIGI